MESILEPTNVQGDDYSKYDDPNRDTILELKVHEALDLAGQVQETEHAQVQPVVVKQLLQ